MSFKSVPPDTIRLMDTVMRQVETVPVEEYAITLPVFAIAFLDFLERVVKCRLHSCRSP